MNPSFKTVGLIGKYKSPEIAEPLLRLADFLVKHGVKVLIDRLTASHIGDNKYRVLALEEIGRQAYRIEGLLDKAGDSALQPAMKDLAALFQGARHPL